jgi:hypothetical protein
MELQCSAVQERWHLNPFDFISSSCCTLGCRQQRASASHFRLDGKPSDFCRWRPGPRALARVLLAENGKRAGISRFKMMCVLL